MKELKASRENFVLSSGMNNLFFFKFFDASDVSDFEVPRNCFGEWRARTAVPYYSQDVTVSGRFVALTEVLTVPG